jgi:uncharacterized protein
MPRHFFRVLRSVNEPTDQTLSRMSTGVDYADLMPLRTSYEHGTFSWIELATTDTKAAKEFYGKLFGWSFEDLPAGPGLIYSMCKLSGKSVAALSQMEANRAAPAHWSSYITVDDIDATATRMEQQGGKLLKPPFDVMDVGRMAVVQDPTGAVFCLWQARKHVGAGIVQEPGCLCWNELYTSDTRRAAAFYTATLGWVTEEVDMGPMGIYTLFKRSGEENNKGGMMALPPHMKDVPPHWLAYIAVPDCDQATQRARELRGVICMEPMDIPHVGRFSVVQDPQGAGFALFTSTHG